jgi:hypothetical protein
VKQSSSLRSHLSSAIHATNRGTLKKLRRSLDPMLDQTHALMLRGVAKGIVDGNAPAPARQALIDAGLVEEQSGQHYVVTEQGRRVLAPER